MVKHGFISLPFLIIFSFSMALCSYLTYKTKTELEILESMKEVNQQIQKERLIIESVNCLIQCDKPNYQLISIEDEQAWVECMDACCEVSTSFGKMFLYYDELERRIYHVEIQ
ncbi:MAG: hypothetical protein IJ356_05500 [Erysipelotrichaceae bacterium]|nr:hypothetical protein [Erysipelotrichaceae bacterium]